jgi:hypothetical protein
MKKRMILPFLLAVGVAGCKQPAEVELTPDETATNLEVLAIVLPDTDIEVTAVDTIGVLPDEQVRYTGSCVINATTWDGGTGIKRAAYSRVFIADSGVRAIGRLVGFSGLDLGLVTLNGNLMLKSPHRVPVGRLFGQDSTLVRGVEYLADLTTTYLPDREYTWTIPLHLAPNLVVTTETPEELKVTSPAGGTIVPRARDLHLRWTGGKGRLSIVVSVFEPLQKKSRPLFELRVKANTGHAIIPAKLLALLPQQRLFVFTFILSNKKEITATSPLSGRVFVQAASVHNSYVELR